MKLKATVAPHSNLPVYAAAPDFAGISHWLNTPGDKPLTIAGLRGKVVLIDFWTYSCINCLRTLPHLRAWYAAYHKDGLDIVGVHTPEFAFEHVLSNVEAAVKRNHVTWPVALDNDYGTWNAWSNEYWPADYLVDQQGNVRAYSFGEGDYAKTEDDIRQLLGLHQGRMTDVANLTPTELQTPETYLGPERLDRSRYVGSRLVLNRAATYRLAKTVPQNDISYGGTWTLAGQTATPGTTHVSPSITTRRTSTWCCRATGASLSRVTASGFRRSRSTARGSTACSLECDDRRPPAVPGPARRRASTASRSGSPSG